MRYGNQSPLTLCVPKCFVRVCLSVMRCGNQNPLTLCVPKCFVRVWLSVMRYGNHSPLTLCVPRYNALWSSLEQTSLQICIFIPLANFVCGGYTVFTLSLRPSVRPSVTFCFLNILKSHCWIFIKPCKHVHICKTITLNEKVRARGQLYESYFLL